MPDGELWLECEPGAPDKEAAIIGYDTLTGQGGRRVWLRPAPNLSDLEQKYRQALWLRHGHIGLYGDDGEMQCGTCCLDYKRDPLERIEARLVEMDLERAARPAPDYRTCGHVADEHDPISLACDIEGCDCDCFEEDGEPQC